MIRVEGKKRGNVMLYALSTCIWCMKTKKLLKELGIEYTYEDVDLLEGEEGALIIKKIKKLVETPSFPLIVINDKKVIRGFDEVKIMKELGE